MEAKGVFRQLDRPVLTSEARVIQEQPGPEHIYDMAPIQDLARGSAS